MAPLRTLSIQELGDILDAGTFDGYDAHELASYFMKKLYALEVGDDEVDHILYALNDELGGKGMTKVKLSDIVNFANIECWSLPGFKLSDYTGMRHAIRIVLEHGRFFYDGTPSAEYGHDEEEDDEEDDEDTSVKRVKIIDLTTSDDEFD